jgi:hypothetical protein
VGLRNIELLLKAFKTPYSFYVLGAGVSAGIVPMTHELKDSIITPYLKLYGYPVRTSKPDDTWDRVIDDYNFNSDPWSNEIIKTIPNSLVQLKSLQLLAGTRLAEIPPQYEVFNFVQKQSVIFNMNIDGLAKRYCPDHIVLNAHGEIPPYIVHSAYWNQQIDNAKEFGDDVFEGKRVVIHEVLLPQPEPPNITDKKDYHEARRWFPLAQWIIFIGYSFGTFHDAIDDHRTLQFFKDLLSEYPKPVIVIDPYPDRIVSLIQEAIKQREVFSIPAYWDCLSQALIGTALSHRHSTILRFSSLTHEICHRYDALCDRYK